MDNNSFSIGEMEGDEVPGYNSSSNSVNTIAADNEMALQKSPAAYVAGKLARHMVLAKTINDFKICCMDCKKLAVTPITGPCGHTRCKTCIGRQIECECGMTASSRNRQRDILVQNIIEKMHYRRPLPKSRVSSTMYHPDDTKFTLMPASPGRVMKSTMRCRLLKKSYKGLEAHMWTMDIPLRRMASIPDYRMQYARHLLYWGRYRDAMAHLAHVAASSYPVSKVARILLAKVIEALCPSDPKRLIRSLYKSIRFELASAWIDNATLECPVCYNLMEQPITTICGHTFCRACITRTLEKRQQCPLCSSDLSDFDLTEEENTMVSALVGAITENPGIDSELTPIFGCTVAFPTITCPLMIFDAEYRKVVRAVLDMGMRRFGMLASLGDETYTSYGTIVDVRDYIELENGKSILSTIGVSRFRVIDKMFINGCPYARVQDHADIVPTSEMSIKNVQILGELVKNRAQSWLSSLDESIRMDIGQHFGPFPEMSLEGEWWLNPNGPSWLWWLIAILPLPAEIQTLMLSTKYLSKRMSAVHRTLNVMATFPMVRPR